VNQFVTIINGYGPQSCNMGGKVYLMSSVFFFA